MDLTGFMFGNINEQGELENDELLDKNSCAYLSRLGIAEEFTGIEEEDVVKEEEGSTRVLSASRDDYDDVDSGAMDYADIDEMAEDEEQKEKHYQLGMKFIDNKSTVAEDDDYDEGGSNMTTASVTMSSMTSSSKAGIPPVVATGRSHDPAPLTPQQSAKDDMSEAQKREQLLSVVQQLFPKYKHDIWLRCSILFPPKPSSLPRLWQDCKKPQKRKKQTESSSSSPKRLRFGKTPPPEMCLSDDEEKLAASSHTVSGEQISVVKEKKSSKNASTISASHWRHGPAKLWYDQLGVPEDGRGFDYGFKLKEKSEQEPQPPGEEDDEGKPPSVIEDQLPLESYSMLATSTWENNIMWDCPPHTGPMKFAIDGQWVTPSDPVYHWQSSGQLPSISMDKVERTKDGRVYSILPAENYNLIHSKWEDDIIWDPDEMKRVPYPKPLQIDYFDPNIVVSVFEEPESSESAEKEGRKDTKGRSKSSGSKSGDNSQMLSLHQQKNMFNISRDEYYNPRHTAGDNVMAGTGQIVQHSIPACQLHPLWFPTHYKTHHLRNFHRPKFGRLVDQNTDSCLMYGLVKHISRKDKAREREVINSGGGEVFFMRTSEDLSACDGHVILCEYSEEFPPHLMNIGMATKIRNYYKRPERQVKDHAPTMKYGDTTYVQNKIGYLLGNLKPGQVLQCFDNNLFRAPIYHHLVPETDFLVIKAEDKLFLREVEDIFVVGQQCPKVVIPGPNSKADKEFQKNYLSVFLYRLFIESEESDDPLMEPHTIKMEWVRQAFPNLHENGVRKRLKLMADFQRVGSESGCWILRRDVRLPSEEELRSMITPEQVCCWASMLASEQRLKDAGYGGKSLFAEEDEDDDGKLDDEILCAPWNTTKAYVEAIKGKHQLQVTGPADPTGSGEGFSYTKMPKVTSGKEDSVTMPAKKSGTDADLRKLKLKHAKNVLRDFGVSEEEIGKMKRWQVIDMVRTMSTEAAKAGGGVSYKFARGGRFSQLEAQERHQQECQRIFNLQNQILYSKEVLSTDDESSSGAGESDDELGKNLENMLHGNRHKQFSQEQEEQEREELRKMLSEDKKPSSSRVASPAVVDEDTSSLKSFASSSAGNKLVISRTFNVDDREFVRTEVVTNSAVIDAYMKIAGNKQLKSMFAGQDEQARENMRREKRRIQDRLRRLKKEKVTKKPKKEKPKSAAAIKMKCGACGQLGHMKTNKNCPMFVKDPSTIVDTTPTTFKIAMTAEEEAAQQETLLSQDELITKVEGTKISFAKTLIDHANDMRKKALLLKFPTKDKLKRTGRQHEMDYLTEGPVKQAKRRRTSPEVLLASVLDEIWNKLKTMPESMAFQKPVNSKAVPDYYNVIKFPMDLQTMKSYLKTHYYSSREQFLEHFNLIVTNCITYNGFEHELTQNAQRLLEVCTAEIKKHEDELTAIEKQINPALDNNAHVALSYRLEMVVNRMKNVPSSAPFHHPVSEKKLPNYHKVISIPMDLETMRKKCKKHAYHSREEFLADVTQINQNSATFNGPDSFFTKVTEAIKEVSLEALNENAVEFDQLEGKIQLASQQLAEGQDDSLLPGSSSVSVIPRVGDGEDSMDIDVGGMDMLLEDLRTSPQHSSDDSLDSDDSDDELSAVGTPSSLPIESSQMTNQSSLSQISQPSPDETSSSSDSSSSEEESELEDD